MLYAVLYSARHCPSTLNESPNFIHETCILRDEMYNWAVIGPYVQ